MVAVKMVKEPHNDEDVTGLLREAEIMKVKSILALKQKKIRKQYHNDFFTKPFLFC